MVVDGTSYTSLWYEPGSPDRVFVIDQKKLPFSFDIKTLKSTKEVFTAIREMIIRGAPVIGAAAAWGLYLEAFQNTSANLYQEISDAAARLLKARPTAVNLKKGLDYQWTRITPQMSREEMIATLRNGALAFARREVEACQKIGIHGLSLIEEVWMRNKKRPIHILTHCNAGWLACIDYGTALAPVYLARGKGIPVHVFVDETRPRNQGSRLTMWELQKAGVPCTLIADNTGGHLMQHGMIDMVLVGSDRTTRRGDVVNKIGTYLKALAAHDNQVPFYAALPSSTVDFELSDGLTEITVEERSGEEILMIRGLMERSHEEASIRIAPEGSVAANYAFDVTPARLVTGLITEYGIYKASEEGINKLWSASKEQSERRGH